jgi:hypothetical protein
MDSINDTVAFVFAPYIITSDLRIVPKYLNEGTQPTEIEQYNPFNEEILSALSKVNVEKNDSILDFCNKYGFLGESVYRSTFGQTSSFLNGLATNTDKEESLAFWISSIQEFKETLDLYEKIQSKDQSLASVSFFKPFPVEFPGLEPINNEDFLSKANIALNMRVNKHLHYISPRLRTNKKGKNLPGETGLTLLSVAYYQLYKTVSNNGSFKICEYCGAYFVPNTKSTRFCQTFKTGNRSACENNKNALVRRLRQNIAKGRSIEEEAKRLGRSIEQLQSWLNK